MSKLAVIYAYFEKNEEYRTNLDYFVKKGVYPNDENIDYYFVVNGETNYVFPEYNNVQVVYRENVGFDFAGYNCGIQLAKNVQTTYDYYFFINTSCRGPFIPEYCERMKWTEPFLNLFKKDETIKLVGSTINMLTWSFRPHVQSYMFCIQQDALRYIEDTSNVFEKSYDNIMDVVGNQEIELSLCLLRNGWNISCLLPEWQNINYSLMLKQLVEGGTYSSITINNRTYNGTFYDGDITWPGKLCFGRDIHPYEVVFIKTERGVSSDEIKSLSGSVL
jgi:hypothetical protein